MITVYIINETGGRALFANVLSPKCACAEEGTQLVSQYLLFSCTHAPRGETDLPARKLSLTQ